MLNYCTQKIIKDVKYSAMWRWISSVRGAIRQHLHGPRVSSTGVYVEEEKDNVKEEQKQENTCSSTKFRQDEYKNNGPDHEWWFRKRHCNFWAYLNSNNTLEAIGWGAAVVLGIQLSKRHPKWFDHKDQDNPSRGCLLHRVAYSLPGQTKRSVVDSDNVHKIFEGKDVLDVNNKKQEDADKETCNLQNEKSDPLNRVMTDFQNVCKKYVGVAKNLEGYTESQKGNMSKAFNSWSEGSHLGYAKAQFNLGLCFETGQGVPRNIREAVKCYKLAAEDGHSQAQYNLALLYLEGDGVEKNPKYAISLLEKAAKSGFSKAQMYLGVHYTEEESRDMEKAVMMFTEAARQNEPEAQYFLGVCYEQGWGVDVNECKATELYMNAASGGHDGAMYNLAVFHELGFGGLPEDRVSAMEMYKKAADLGNEQAQMRLECLDESYKRKWNQGYPTCKMNELFTDLAQFDKLEEKPSEEPIKVVVKEDNPRRMNSSPSLTDYVRQHLQEFSFNKESIDLLTSSEVAFTEVKSSVLMPQWQLELRSPQVSNTNSSPVLFSLGADEDDIESIESLNSGLEHLNWNAVRTQNYNLCSMTHRTSTMPDLQAVPCS